MKYTKGILASILMTVLFVGCATIRGNTLAEQRQYVLDMMDEALVRLYNENPIAKEQIKNAAGYGVFSNINSNIFLLSTGSGYGVVTDLGECIKLIFLLLSLTRFCGLPLI